MKQTAVIADRITPTKAPYSVYNPNTQIYSRNGCPLRTTTAREFKVRVHLVKQIRGDAKWTGVILLVPQRVMAIKQYHLSGGYEDITGTIKELANVGII